MTLRCAIYLRHSTDRNKTENQKPEVEQIAKSRNYTVVSIFEEGASAVKKRPEYERMMKEARRGGFDVLIVWAIDRFGRSMVGNLTDVLELDRIGVKVVSVRESWLDTGSPVRTLLIAIFSWCAEQERNRLVERTKAGLASARRRGVRVGRPPARLDRDHLLDLKSQGWSVRKIAASLGVGSATVQRRLLSIAPEVTS